VYHVLYVEMYITMMSYFPMQYGRTLTCSVINFKL